MPTTDPDTYLQAASALTGLPIRPEHADAVRTAFAVLTTQAQMLASFPLPAETEQAPRFTP